MIPKHIHQIWIQGKEHLKKTKPVDYINSEELQKLFPSSEFKYTLWDDETIKKEMSGNSTLLSIYISVPIFAAKADIARYFLLNKYGGLYLDMDFEAFENFWWLFSGNVDIVTVIPDRLGKDIKVLSSSLWNSQLGMNNAIIGSIPNNAILVDLILFLETKTDMKPGNTAWSGIVEFTGPLQFETLVLKHFNNCTANVRFLPSSLLEPIHPLDGTNHIICNNREECKKVFPTAVGIHRPALSWVKAGTLSHKVLTKGINIYGFLKEWSLVIILLLSLCTFWLGYKQCVKI